MTVERIIRILAGTLVLTGLSLGYTLHQNWYLLSAFVGVNLFQSGFSKWCLAESILKKYLVRNEK